MAAHEVVMDMEKAFFALFFTGKICCHAFQFTEAGDGVGGNEYITCKGADRAHLWQMDS